MSGLDPLAALAAQAVANAQAAMDEAVLSLDLGVDVAVLQAQVNVGEVIAATVLPPQGGTDLLSFLGQTVPAQIPPGIDPGETMLLQVTGFTNSAIIVKNLGTLDPENPVPTVNVEIPPQEPGAPQSAVLTTKIPVNVPPASTPPPLNPAQTTTSTTNVAPPREIFVAASVRPNLAQAIDEAQVAADGGSDVEARLAISRASAAPPPPAPPAQAPSAAAQSASSPPASSASAAQARAAPPQSFPVAPPIVRPAATAAQAPAQLAQPQALNPTPRQTAPASPLAALLARLRIPITPVTLAAARTINTATQSVSSSYEQLESALAKFAPETSGALRSMLAFVARFDLRDVRALPEQIATFVSDVLDGAEAKLAQVVSAWNELEAAPETLDTPASAGPQTPAAQPSLAQPSLAQLPQNPPAPQAPAAATPANTVAVAATAAERLAAMDYDVKSVILAMIASSSERADAPAIAGALRDALTATTALQLNVLNAQTTDPRAISIPLPAYFYPGGEPSMLRISRDAPNRKNAMDADNFHIAFVLDTKSLGTVAIDVQTVGRSVSIDVKTQAMPAADRFRSTLGDLRSRLEQMHYQVAAIGAGVAPPAGAAPAKSEPPEPAERKSFWDMRA